MSKELRDLLGAMFSYNPQDRPTCEEVLVHRWCKKPIQGNLKRTLKDDIQKAQTDRRADAQRELAEQDNSIKKRKILPLPYLRNAWSCKGCAAPPKQSGQLVGIMNFETELCPCGIETFVDGFIKEECKGHVSKAFDASFEKQVHVTIAEKGSKATASKTQKGVTLELNINVYSSPSSSKNILVFKKIQSDIREFKKMYKLMMTRWFMFEALRQDEGLAVNDEISSESQTRGIKGETKFKETRQKSKLSQLKKGKTKVTKDRVNMQALSKR